MPGGATLSRPSSSPTGLFEGCETSLWKRPLCKNQNKQIVIFTECTFPVEICVRKNNKSVIEENI
jgi:hypothetical protein